MLLEMDVDDLIDEQKTISTKLEWEKQAERVYVIGPVTVNSKIFTTLVFYANKNPNRLLLMLRDSEKRPYQIFRRYDNVPHHRNPDGTVFEAGHKHKWTDAEGNERFAYIPDPPINDSDLDEALVQFLDECNIKLENGADSYPKEYTQLSLNDISFTEGAKGGFEMTEEVEDDDKI